MEKEMGSATRKCIIVTGPESTGKTYLASCLAEKFEGDLIEEYARSYILELGHEYNYSDILHIADTQKTQFLHSIKHKRDVPLFVDTYLVITKVWFQWLYQNYPAWIDRAIEETKGCLYLLCYPDIEWKEDGVRENGGENRLKLYFDYKAELLKKNLLFKEVYGDFSVRMKNATNFVKDFLLS